jgi:hypothetical protein
MPFAPVAEMVPVPIADGQVGVGAGLDPERRAGDDAGAGVAGRINGAIRGVGHQDADSRDTCPRDRTGVVDGGGVSHNAVNGAGDGAGIALDVKRAGRDAVSISGADRAGIDYGKIVTPDDGRNIIACDGTVDVEYCIIARTDTKTIPRHRRARIDVVGIVVVAQGAVAIDTARPAIGGVDGAIDGRVAGGCAGGTADGARLGAADRERSEHQRQPEHQQPMPCKGPLRQSVRDFPLHFNPHSHSDVTAAAEIRGFRGQPSGANFFQRHSTR